MMWYDPQPFTLGGDPRANLKITGLSAGYGPFLVLRDLALEVRPGLTVILGPNGAGKTTLLRILATLQEADAGTVRLGDIDVRTSPSCVSVQPSSPAP